MDKDLKSLSSIETGSPLTVFLPSVSEMYPSGITLDTKQQVGAFVEVKGLSEQLEGAIRPQFFRGVATVVNKLLNVIIPERAYFGQKDIQQTVVVRRMVKDLLMPTQIVVAPTSREESGLAMSSRNDYLSEKSRLDSKILYESLCAGQQAYKDNKTSRKEILDAINSVLRPCTDPGSNFHVEIEYISLADKESLKEVDQVIPGKGAIISGAIKVPNKVGTLTRIIDNVILE